MPAAAEALAATPEAAHDAACAVMTTDTVAKEASFVGKLPAADGSAYEVHVGGFVKGSGMIQPNMATMLCVLTTDAPLDQRGRARGASQPAVDADLQQGHRGLRHLHQRHRHPAGHWQGRAGGGERGRWLRGLPGHSPRRSSAVCGELARKIASDGEGSTKLVTVNVLGAANDADADAVARAIANSPLVKTAIFGHDANWGRVAAAAGKCGVPFDQRDG